MNYVSNSRYERKFVIPSNKKYYINHLIASSEFRFIEHYEPRIVNSIYLDTKSLKSYKDNISGISKRSKIRIRWYGKEKTVNNAVLEIKSKYNNLGNKKIIPIKNLGLDYSLNSFSEIKEYISKINNDRFLDLELRKLEPTMFISYSRKYFLSRILNCRLTLDDQIEYKRLRIGSKAFLKCNSSEDDIILEIKYPTNLELSQYSELLNLPFRMTKNSKYVNGLNKLLRI